MDQGDGRRRIVIEQVSPEINGGDFFSKRVIGEKIKVEADVFCDGHDHVCAELLYRFETDEHWKTARMRPLVNDRWTGEFRADRMGLYHYTIRGWVDHFATWRVDLLKKFNAGQDVKVELEMGASLLDKAAKRAKGQDSDRLTELAGKMRNADQADGVDIAESSFLSELMGRYPDMSFAQQYDKELGLWVDREKAGFSSWYEFFPRSCPSDSGHGRFRDCEPILEDVSKMGFDVVYLPPVHPIGTTNRKGKNNTPEAGPEDVGSPWAIGSKEGGHDAIAPELGTEEDFKWFVDKAESLGLEVAIDLAFQCSPDHPYVQQHPEWFKWRPDGSVQYAENPPKKYQDVLPLNFETENWRELWEELRRVVLVWIGRGVKIFRVDNPHTKPFPFWQWLIGQVRSEHPEVLFLAEAFTRPKVMKRLAKLGFSQSYTYFTWRNTKWELTEYLKELTKTETAEYFRPNFWPNTPDILPQYLQFGTRASFIIRLVLAATLSSNYGIYGPVFELCVSEASADGAEYYESEKYQIKQYDRNASGNIKAIVERVNRVRKENTALQKTVNLEFYDFNNEAVICYGKSDEAGKNQLIIIVNLDPYHKQSGWVTLPLDKLGIDENQPYMLHDQLSNSKYIWQGRRNYIELDPKLMPVHILRVNRRLRRETDFDYFM